MLNVKNVSVRYGMVQTLTDVSLCLPAGQTLAVVGESGAGKSTLIAAILGLVKLNTGQITWANAPVKNCRPSLVMQEPRSAFNPFLPLRRSIMEPLVARGEPIDEMRLLHLCDRLELPLELLDRKPRDVSIGQVQRAGILRGLIAGSPLILLDEPLSALDAVTQKHTAQLIADLQKELGFAAFIVTHDLGYAAAFSNEIAVLRQGRVEEITPTPAFIHHPQSEYGCALRAAAFALGALECVG
ncbi:MAG: ATP-binding cassette domain-containing protein [Sulfitobacter sp.]